MSVNERASVTHLFYFILFFFLQLIFEYEHRTRTVKYTVHHGTTQMQLPFDRILNIFFFLFITSACIFSAANGVEFRHLVVTTCFSTLILLFFLLQAKMGNIHEAM